jgi:hypothetical protein
MHAHLLPRLSRSWTVLLPSDTYRKPITSITTVLLPFVTYLLTLPCITQFGFVIPTSPYIYNILFTLELLFYHEEISKIFLRNIRNLLPDYMQPHPRRQ